MAEKYDMGTPLGGERTQKRRVMSPLQEMDGVRGQLDFTTEEHPAPSTPKEAEPVTMAAISALLLSALDEKLAPVTQTMGRLEGEVESLKKHVTENEEKLQTNNENINTRLDTMDNEFKTMKAEFQKYKENKNPWAESFRLQTGSAPRPQAVPQNVPDGERSRTAMFTGLDSSADGDSATAWLQTRLQSLHVAATDDDLVYYKGDVFEGRLFAKFSSTELRDQALRTFRMAKVSHNNNAVKCKPDLPIKKRFAYSVLFGLKYLLCTVWTSHSGKQVKVDLDKQTVKVKGY